MTPEAAIAKPVNMSVARQQLGKHILAPTDTYATTKKLVESFSLRYYDTVAYLPKARTVMPQKPRNTHATIEVRVFTARCWVTHATMDSLLSAPQPLLYNNWYTRFNNKDGVFCVIGAEAI
jgi:hypothetical protein